ncbi:hypothetical protein ACOJB1_13165 [Enterococcus innesii]|uniref:hypothetical protein n=1 Tax=Enterococcus innesii TaxID=2839759 RepID=UPI003B5982EA
MKKIIFLVGISSIFFSSPKVLASESSQQLTFELTNIDFKKENYYLIETTQIVNIDFSDKDYNCSFRIELISNGESLTSELLAINNVETNEIDFSNVDNTSFNLTIKADLNVKDFLVSNDSYYIIVKFESTTSEEVYYEKLPIDSSEASEDGDIKDDDVEATDESPDESEEMNTQPDESVEEDMQESEIPDSSDDSDTTIEEGISKPDEVNEGLNDDNESSSIDEDVTVSESSAIAYKINVYEERVKITGC